MCSREAAGLEEPLEGSDGIDLIYRGYFVSTQCQDTPFVVNRVRRDFNWNDNTYMQESWRETKPEVEASGGLYYLESVYTYFISGDEKQFLWVRHTIPTIYLRRCQKIAITQTHKWTNPQVKTVVILFIWFPDIFKSSFIPTLPSVNHSSLDDKRISNTRYIGTIYITSI